MKIALLLILILMASPNMAQISSSAGISLNLFGDEDKVPKVITIPSPQTKIMASDFLKRHKDKNQFKRQEAAMALLLKGHIADYSVKMQPIYLTKTIGGAQHTLKLWVTRDYLALGQDSDSIRFPLSMNHTEKLLKKFGALLPTTLLVEEIYQQSLLKVFAHPLPPIAGKMASFNYYSQIEKLIVQDLKGKLPIGLVAGHKKDLVFTKKLKSKPNSVAIFGWYYPNGKPIQNLNLAHDDNYVDYSHGIRLVAPNGELNGKEIELKKLLKDPKLHVLLSDEGPLEL